MVTDTDLVDDVVKCTIDVREGGFLFSASDGQSQLVILFNCLTQTHSHTMETDTCSTVQYV